MAATMEDQQRLRRAKNKVYKLRKERRELVAQREELKVKIRREVIHGACMSGSTYGVVLHSGCHAPRVLPLTHQQLGSTHLGAS